MEKKKRTVPAGVMLAGCVLCLLLGGVLTLAGIWAAVEEDGIALLQAQRLINTHFVGDYDAGEAHEAALEAMVDSLHDRWSSYLSPEEYRQVQDTRRNAYVGIGVTIEDGEEDGLLVIQVTPEGPGDRAGIQPGETITAVDGVTITQGNRDDCVEMIRGESGTKVTLKVKAEDGNVRTVEVTRGQVQGVSAHWTMLEDQIGLVTLSNFYTGAAEQVRQGVEELMEQGAQALIFDVRNNPGGYVTELTGILDLLLPQGVIFRSESWNGREEVYTSDAECIHLPLAVLVNGDSYSAAEFLAAQLHESADAVIAGAKTSGKGYSQLLYPLRDGSGINLSTARYFTGGGVSLIGTGLTPDPYVEMSYKKQWELYLGRLAPQDDGQLQAAIKSLAGKVPLDTAG